MTYNFVYLSAI